MSERFQINNPNTHDQFDLNNLIAQATAAKPVKKPYVAPEPPPPNPHIDAINESLVGSGYVDPTLLDEEVTTPVPVMDEEATTELPTVAEHEDHDTEVLPITVDPRGLSKRGLKRYRRREAQIDDLDISDQVHRDGAGVFLTMEPDPKDKKFGGPSPLTQYRENFPDSFPQYDPEAVGFSFAADRGEGLAPVTFNERRVDKRMGASMSQADLIRSSALYRLKQIWDDDEKGLHIGTEDFVERINAMRMSPLERRRAIKAHKQFQKLERKAQGKEDQVRQVAQGEDPIGRQLAENRDKLETKQEKVARKSHQTVVKRRAQARRRAENRRGVV